MTITILVVIFMAAITVLSIFLIIERAKTQRLTIEIYKKRAVIENHLLIMHFPSRHYVLPYVYGTSQKEVFFLLSDPRASKALYEIMSTEEAKRRITEMHQSEMEEMDRLGI